MPQSRRAFLAAIVLGILVSGPASAQEAKKRHSMLYVVEPGIRNYVEFGGAGILVFDVDKGHKFVRRISTPASLEKQPSNIKGVCACALTGKLYFTTLKKLYCVDIRTEKALWEKSPPDGCDRLSITPDGKWLYVPTLEKDHWNIIDGDKGELVTRIETKNGTHNTVVSLDGSHMYLAGLRSGLLPVADTNTHKIVQTLGPFSAGIRPLTVNADQSLVFVTVNGLLGFEIGDIKSGKVIQRVEVQGFKTGPTKRHGCPSHGVGLTPDEKEVWVCDAHNSHVHVFDATVMPPKQIASVKLREQPGWVTFSVDGRFAYPSTGDVIDTKTRQIVTSLMDEENREVHSEKIVELIFDGDELVAVGDQFGVGRKGMKR
jgi:DNA-binding beta-propeller fold protein YncE